MDNRPATAAPPPPDPATWTAVAALWGRAVEQAHEQPLLHDPAAAAWLEALGLDTSSLSRATATRVAVCARARVIDDWVTAWSAEHANGVVVELGIGFSTRAQRLAHLGPDFLGVDREDPLRRREALDSSPKQETLAADLAQPESVDFLRDRIGSRPACFIAEGLLMFLDRSRVEPLLSRLATAFPGEAFIFDAYAPPARLLQRFHDSLRRLGEPLRSTFTLSPHLKIIESRTLRDQPDAFARLPWVYRLPGVHRLHATRLAVLTTPGSAR